METKEKKIISNGPYFNTTITTTIGLHPSQMTKQIYDNLKQNLVKKHQNKCFKSYGFISKIYNITKREGGIIVPENSLSPAMFKVDFTCKLCRPLKNSNIVCEVKSINKVAIFLRNGPIHVFIFFGDDNQINKNIFSFDEEENVIKGKVDKDKSVKIVVGSYINVKCIDIRVENGTQKIIIWGIMDSVATKEERDRAIIESDKDDIPFVDYEDYTQAEDDILSESDADLESEAESEAASDESEV